MNKKQWIAGTIMTALATLMVMSAAGMATDAVQTIGLCTDSYNIQYTTTFTLNGETKTITSTAVCKNGCMKDATDYGDECIQEKAQETPIMPIILWMFGFGFIIWFGKVYKSHLFNSLLMFFNAMAGVLVTQSILILIPIVITLINVIYAWTKPNWHQGGD